MTSVRSEKCPLFLWFSSYLCGRTFQVVYGDSTSSTMGMFRTTRLSARSSASVYTVHARLIVKTTSRNMAFADDTQLYVHCRLGDVTSAVLRLGNCIEEVSHWMSSNCLRLNADKTELLWAGSRHGPALLGSAGPSSQLGTETVAASDQVRVVGVTLTSVGPVSRQARCQRLCDVLLLALPTQTGPTFT